MNAEQTGTRHETPEFYELLREGYLALSAGDKARAHDLWRRAATIAPYNEEIWVALLDVLDTPEDRRVCLQNILRINPANLYARQQLNEQLYADASAGAAAGAAFSEETQPVDTRKTQPTPILTDAPSGRRVRFGYVLLRVVEIFALAAGIAFLIAVLVWGL